MSLRLFPLVVCSLGFVASHARADDWPQFRGPQGKGDVAVAGPATWGPGSNILWQVKLPGPGASSPIILGNKLFVTSYSGFAVQADNPGSKDKLVRHLSCLDAVTGNEIWKKDLHTQSPEAPYQGFMTQHGYASNTPATDGKQVFVFLGTGGVVAFDLDGNEKWKKSVGTGTDGWGSGSSLVLHDSLVIVNAAIESDAVIALRKDNGQQEWKFAVSHRSWSTPALVQVEGGKTELVISSQGKISGVDPTTGKELWHCDGIADYVCPSVPPGNGVAFVAGGRQSQVIAVRCGGSGDVDKTHVLWKQRVGGNVTTPVLHEDHLFGVSDRGIAYCVNAKTGAKVYEQRLESAKADVKPAAFQPPPGRGRGRGFGGPGGPGGRGGFGGGIQLYASAVVAGDLVYAVSRSQGTFVIAAEPEFKLVSQNKLPDDATNFDGTPAIVDGKLYLRSNDSLYCIGAK